jgi:hypothetical protein
MSEAELQVKERHALIYASIKRQDFSSIDWEGVVDDLASLGWLEEGDSSLELISSVWSITEKNAAAGLKDTPRFRILKLSRAKVFITTVAHNISNLRDDVRTICALCKKHITDFSLFPAANLLLKDSTAHDTDFLKVVEVYEESKAQITSSLIHLDKSYSIETGKSIGKHLDETFYIKVISPNSTSLRDLPSIATQLSKYSAYTSSTRQTGSSYYSSYPYTTYQRDSVYLGELTEDSKREGFGKCSYYNGDSFEGFWQDDRPHGKGLYSWKNGGRYEGDFIEGRMQGKGKRIFGSGAVYEGDFEAGKKHGVGEILFKNGDRYVGGWEFDDMSGSGVYTWHTGDSFTGKFRRDKREGPGVLLLESGEEIQGEWLDGKLKTTPTV